MVSLTFAMSSFTTMPPMLPSRRRETLSVSTTARVFQNSESTSCLASTDDELKVSHLWAAKTRSFQTVS